MTIPQRKVVGVLAFLETNMPTQTIEGTTLGDIDEALTHLSRVPIDERGAGWRAFMDAMLEQRKDLEN